MARRMQTLSMALAAALLPAVVFAAPDRPVGKFGFGDDKRAEAPIFDRRPNLPPMGRPDRPGKKAPAPLLGASLPAFAAGGALLAGIGVWRRRRRQQGAGSSGALESSSPDREIGQTKLESPQ